MEMQLRAAGSHAAPLLALLQQDWLGGGYAAETQEAHMAEGKESVLTLAAPVHMQSCHAALPWKLSEWQAVHIGRSSTGGW